MPLLVVLALSAAAAAPLPVPRSWVYQGTVGTQAAVHVYLEETASGLHGLYFYDRHRGELASDLTLEGELGGHEVNLIERDAQGAETGRFALQGALGGPLTGTWSAGARRLPVTLQPGQPFAEGDPSTSFRGFLGGKHQVWVNLKVSGRDLVGDYRYARSLTSLRLSGHLTDDQGGFALEETDGRGRTTGRMVGRYLERREIAGSWLSPDGTRRLALRLSEADPLDEVTTLQGGLQVIPRQEVHSHRSCASEITWPELSGGQGGWAALNALLKRTWSGADPLKDEDCEMAEGGAARSSAVVGFDVESLRRGHLTLSRKVWAYTGGAHGNGSTECLIFDLAAGRAVDLRSSLSEDARARLARLVAAQLRSDNDTRTLTEAGFFKDEIELGPEVDLCPGDDGLAVEFDPYEIAPYVMGPVVAILPYEKVRPLFARNPLTDALLAP